MGYNVPKPPFNLAEFLSQKAPARSIRRGFKSQPRPPQRETVETLDEEASTPAKPPLAE